MRLGIRQLSIIQEHIRGGGRVSTTILEGRIREFMSSSEFNSSLKRMRAIGLLEQDSDSMDSLKLTPKGLFEYLRNGGGTMDSEGRNFLRELLVIRPNFMDGYGEKESEFIEKCLILGFSPRFSEKPSPRG